MTTRSDFLAGARAIAPLLPPGATVGVVTGLGAGAYAFRLSFIHPRGLVDGFPQTLERALTSIPAAILAALVTPAIFPPDGSLAGVTFDARASAGALAWDTAWRTGSMISTIGVGSGVRWTVTVLPG